MASPEKIAPLLPETLPEDFSDWDGEASAMPVPGEWKASEDAHSFGVTAKPPGQSAEYNAILESLRGKPRASVSASPAPILVKQQRDLIDWDREDSPAAPPENRNEWEARETAHSFGKSRKPLGLPADRDAMLESLLDTPRAAVSGSPAPVLIRQQSDLIDWDREESLAAPPENRNEWEASEDAHSFGVTAKPTGQSAEYNAILESLRGKPRASVSASPAPVLVKQQRDLIDWDSEESPAAPPADRSEWEAWESGHSVGKSPKPPGQSADRDAKLPPVADRAHVSGSGSVAPVSLKPKKPTSRPVDGSPSQASHSPERNASNSGHLEGVQGGFLSTKKPLEERGSGHTGSDSAVAASRTTNKVPVVPSSPNAASTDGPSNSPELAAPLGSEAGAVLFQMFRPKNIAVKEERKTATKKSPRKKWITVSAICACGILLSLKLMTPLFHHAPMTSFHHGAMSVAKPSVQPPPGASDAQLKTNTPAPPAREPLTLVALPATSERQQATDRQPAKEDAGTILSLAQTKMMNDQLAAPIRIPHQTQNQFAENGPPPVSFGAAGANGLGGNGAVDGFLRGHTPPAIQVAPPKPLVVSSGVAAGMLIQKPPPTYPSIAKSGRVSGTVELHAVISETGAVKDVQVVSGPAMLRQAAVDAVRQWRYKPYRLNNEPVEVETTVNVIFTLGG